MINNVRQAIADKLKELYPSNTIYMEEVPQSFAKPSFLIALASQDYSKRLNHTYKSLLSFEVAYFSEKDTADIKEDCLQVQLALLRAFDLVGGYRIQNKQAVVNDNVLRFTFKVSVSEMETEESIRMQKLQTNTNL